MKPVTLHWVMQRKTLKTAMNYLCCVLLKVRTSRVRIWRQVVSYELTHSVSSGSCLDGGKKKMLSFPVQSKLIKPLPFFCRVWFNCCILLPHFYIFDSSEIHSYEEMGWLKNRLPTQGKLSAWEKVYIYHLRWKWPCFQKFWCFKAVYSAAHLLR